MSQLAGRGVFATRLHGMSQLAARGVAAIPLIRAVTYWSAGPVLTSVIVNGFVRAAALQMGAAYEAELSEADVLK